MGAVRHDERCHLGPEDLGPYLLGGLGAAEQAEVARAVHACPACLLQVSRLRPVVEVLDRAWPEELGERPAPVPREGLRLETVLEDVARQRTMARRRRIVAVVAGVAAACLLAVAVLVGLPQKDVTRVPIATAGVTGQAALASADGGTRIDLTVAGLKPNASYGVWLEDDGGRRVPAGSFSPDADGRMELELHAALPLDHSAALGITQLGGKDMLREPLPEG
ncbi:MAG: hypothetical protein ACLGIA_02625 [Actinomycetes bacterium]